MTKDFFSNYADFIEKMTDAEYDNLGKSMLIHKKGNLLDMAEAGEFDVIVQGCNCFNTMGKGIAKEIKDRFPNAYTVDQLTKEGDYNKLGTYTIAPNKLVDHTFLIVNAYTQYTYWNTDDKKGDLFEYTSFEMILQKLAREFGTKRIGMPYVGMGLAGGDTEVIMEQIEYFASKVAATGGQVTLVKFG